MTELQKAISLRRYFMDCRDRKKCTLMDYTSMIKKVDEQIANIIKKQSK